MNKATFLKNLASVIWARIGQDVIFFTIFISALLGIVLTVGQISLWCGMPPVGSEGMGNALTGIPRFDNGLLLIVFSFALIITPIFVIYHIIKAVKEFVTNLIGIIKQAAEKSVTIPNNPNDTRTPEQKMIDADRRTFDGNPN